MIPPADKAYCTVVPLIIPAAAEELTFRYWADQLQNRKLGQAPTLAMLGQVGPNSDIAWAKFENARAKELVDLTAYGAQPARYVWAVFKRWTGGGIPRLAGLEVTYRLPKK
jgi:hypothetical protein